MAANGNGAAEERFCLDVWALPLEVVRLPQAERLAAVQRYIRKVDDDSGELRVAAPISLREEATVVAFFMLIMGGPLAWIALGLGTVSVGSWSQLGLYGLGTALLALHPLPKNSQETTRASWLAVCLFRYFSYRVTWSGNAFNDMVCAAQKDAWIAAAPPHGVLPIANILSLLAVPTIGPCKFVGAAANVVFRTPFLRYMTLFGAIDASAKSLVRTIKSGTCVGLVPDGIAGMFMSTGNEEVVYMKTRMSLARLALRANIPLALCYSIGNTEIFSSWFDPWGILAYLSRRFQASLLIFWGRWGLAVPRRVQITTIVNSPLYPEKVEGEMPTEEQIQNLHNKLLGALQHGFDEHKKMLGWGHKQLRFM